MLTMIAAEASFQDSRYSLAEKQFYIAENVRTLKKNQTMLIQNCDLHVVKLSLYSQLDVL